MNCYRIAAFVIAAAIMASVFSGCSQDGESTVSTSNTTVSDTSQTEATAMPEYAAKYTLSNENADEITQIAASEIESEQEEISMQHYEKIMAELPPEGIFDLQDGVTYPDFQKYTYYSQTAQRESRVNVLLPPDYSEDKEYPVLYVLHGYYDNEDWIARDIVGLSKMLSNLYASGEAQEMIVVCPYIFVSKELAWCRLEPQDGSFDFGWLEDIIGILTERGIRIVLCTPTNCPPLWFYEKYPEAVQTEKDGHKSRTGIRGHRCINNTDFLRYAERIIDVMTKRYADNESVIAWQIDNELEANFCFCETCIGKYRNWLNPSYMLDFNRYASDSVTEHINWQAELIRKRFPHTPVTTNVWFCRNMPNYYDEFRGLDFISYDNYPTTRLTDNAEECYSHAFHLDLMRGIKRSKFWIMEQLSGGLGCWAPMDRTPSPGMIKGYSLQSFAHSADTAAQ